MSNTKTKSKPLTVTVAPDDFVSVKIGEEGLTKEEIDPADYSARNNDPANTAPAKITYLPTSFIEPSPLNPRTHFDEAKIEELAESIRRHGVRSPIEVRLQPVHTVLNERYWIVAGERRFRAARLAGLLTIPTIIRHGMTDQEHAEIALEENEKRADLTPIERARGYKQCLDLGTTQEALGEKAGVGQSRISNLVRLLDLPADVQQMIDRGDLSTAHGIALARWKDFPRLASALAQAAVSSRFTSKDLEAGLTYQTTGPFRANKDILVNLVGYDPRPAFDWKQVCKKECPFGAFRGSSSDTGGDYCLRPEHFNDLQAEGLKKQEAERKAQAEAERERLLKVAKRSREAAQEATSKTARDQATREADAAASTAKVLAKGLPELAKMDYNSFNRVTDAGGPPGCSEGCPCRAKGVDYHGAVIEICLDRRRYQSLEQADTRARQKERKSRLAPLTERILSIPEVPDPRGWALLCWDYLQRMGSGKHEAKMAVAEALLAAYPDDPDVARAAEVLQHAGNMGTNREVDRSSREALAALPTSRLTALTVRVFLLTEVNDALISKSDATRAVDWYWEEPEQVEPQPVDGGSAVYREEDYALVACLRCEAPIPEAALDEIDDLIIKELAPSSEKHPEKYPSTVVTPSGVLRTHGAHYCASCASSVAVCRACGCTDEVACDGGCEWAEINQDDPHQSLCSACVPAVDAPQTDDPPVEAPPSPERPLCASCGMSAPNAGGKFCDLCDCAVAIPLPTEDAPTRFANPCSDDWEYAEPDRPLPETGSFLDAERQDEALCLEEAVCL